MKTKLQIILFVIAFSLLASLSYAGQIALQWDADTDPVVVGYKLYYQPGTDGSTFTGTGAIEGASPIDIGNVTDFTVSGLDLTQNYSFAVTAYDSAGNESSYSNIVVTEAVIPAPIDQDQDGYAADVDCNDADPNLGLVCLAVSQPSISADTQTDVALSLQLPAGQAALIEQFIDANQDGQIDADDLLIRSLAVTDGVTASQPNGAGDEDGAADGLLTTTLSYQDDLDLYHAAATYLFRATAAGDDAVLSFTVSAAPQPQYVSGTVSDANGPRPGVLVALQQDGVGPIGYAVTDPSGSYLLDVRQAGTYTIVPLTFQAGAVTDLYAQPQVSVGAGSSANGVDLTLGSGTYAVSGQIVDEQSGVGVDSLWVTAQNATGVVAHALTDVDGSYQLALPAGSYEVNLQADAPQPLSPAAQGYVGYANLPAAITVASDVNDVNLSVAPATAWVSGQVINSYGAGQAGIAVQAQLATAGQPMATALTAADGSYTLGLSAGDTWAVSLPETAAAGRSLLSTQIDGISTSNTLSGHDLTVYPVTAQIDGQVSDSAGQPLTGLEVSLSNADGSIVRTTPTDAAGQYQLPAFGDDWWVELVQDGIAIQEKQVTLSDGETRSLDFSVQTEFVTAVSLTADAVSPQLVGSSVTFSAVASGSSNVEYQFRLRDPSGVWTDEQTYSADSTWLWDTTGLAAGAYRIEVWAREIGSTTQYDVVADVDFTIESPAAIASPVQIVTLSADSASRQRPGAIVNFAAVADGGAGDYEYQFLVSDPSKNETVVQTYSSAATWTWDTQGLSSGFYYVTVWARNAGSNDAYEASDSMKFLVK